jgi:hypothetical protein
VLRKLIEMRGKVGVLLCRADHRGRINENDLRNLKWPLLRRSRTTAVVGLLRRPRLDQRASVCF